jgi:hypothetical protein
VAEFKGEIITSDVIGTSDAVGIVIANAAGAKPHIQPASFKKEQECRAEFEQGNSP